MKLFNRIFGKHAEKIVPLKEYSEYVLDNGHKVLETKINYYNTDSDPIHSGLMIKVADSINGLGDISKGKIIYTELDENENFVNSWWVWF